MKNQKRAPIEPKKYNQIIEGLELVSIYLIKFSGEKKSDFEFSEQLELEVVPNYSYKHINEEIVEVYSNYMIKLFEKNNPELIFIEIKLNFICELRTKIKFTRNFFAIFKKLNLPLNMWPYVRTFTQFMTSNMGIPPVTLPFFKRL